MAKTADRFGNCLHSLSRVQVVYGHEPAGTVLRCEDCNETIVGTSDKVMEFLLQNVRRLAGILERAGV